MKKIVLAFLIVSILPLISYSESNMSYFIQQPKGESMDLVPFTAKMVNLPFTIKYPAKWYVREEAARIPGVYLTQEILADRQNGYSAGMSAFYKEDYFIRKALVPGMDKPGKVAFRVIKWDENKQQYVEYLKSQGNNILSTEDIKLAGQPALKINYEHGDKRTCELYVKVGKDLIMISFDASKEGYENYEKLFEDMIASFAFKDDFKIIDDSTIFEKGVQEEVRNTNL